MTLVATVIAFISCKDDIQIDSTIELKATSAKQLGKEAFIKGDYFEALDYYYQALDDYRELNDPLQISKVTNNIGSIYSKAGFHSMALNFYHEAFEQRKALDDVEGVAKLYFNIGRAYAISEQTDESRIYLNLADSIFSELGRENYKVSFLNQLGMTYQRDSSYGTARSYFQKALAIEVDKTMTGKLLNNIGYSYQMEGEDSLALSYYRKALKFQTYLKSSTRTYLFQNLGDILQNPDSVAWYYTKGFKKDLIWIDNIYLTTAHTLFLYYYKNDDQDSTMYYADLEHQAGLRGVKQRDEMKRLFDLYQVKTAHFKRQVQQQAAISDTHRLYKWLMSGGAIALMIIFGIVYYYKRKTLEDDIDNNRFVI